MKRIIQDNLNKRLPANTNFLKYVDQEMHDNLINLCIAMYGDNAKVILSGIQATSSGLHINYTSGYVFTNNELFFVNATSLDLIGIRMLNNKCDPDMRRITITGSEIIFPFYFVTNEDYGMYYFDNDEYFANRNNYIYDFIVNVPEDVEASDIYISGLLDKYKLISKIHQIIRI